MLLNADDHFAEVAVVYDAYCRGYALSTPPPVLAKIATMNHVKVILLAVSVTSSIRIRHSQFSRHWFMPSTRMARIL